jgi:hypothetical protein
MGRRTDRSGRAMVGGSRSAVVVARMGAENHGSVLLAFLPQLRRRGNRPKVDVSMKS